MVRNRSLVDDSLKFVHDVSGCMFHDVRDKFLRLYRIYMGKSVYS